MGKALLRKLGGFGFGRCSPQGGRRAKTLFGKIFRLIPQNQVQHDGPRAQGRDDEGQRSVSVPKDECQQQLHEHNQQERQILPGGGQESEFLFCTGRSSV